MTQPSRAEPQVLDHYRGAVLPFFTISLELLKFRSLKKSAELLIPKHVFNHAGVCLALESGKSQESPIIPRLEQAPEHMILRTEIGRIELVGLEKLFCRLTLASKCRKTDAIVKPTCRDVHSTLHDLLNDWQSLHPASLVNQEFILLDDIHWRLTIPSSSTAPDESKLELHDARHCLGPFAAAPDLSNVDFTYAGNVLLPIPLFHATPV